MGSHQHLYSLTWGDFGSSLTSTVQILRGHNEMVDVTLAAGGRIFPAHKLVLGAASPLLMELLKSTHCAHPVVMLAGITAPDLEALLQFVYHGEVSVDPNQLPSLLQAAHCLDIQALSPQTLTTEKTMGQISVPMAMNDPMRDMNGQALPRDMNGQALPRDINGQALARDMNGQALARDMNSQGLSRELNGQTISRDMMTSPLLPMRKRRRKQGHRGPEVDKWTVTDGMGVGGVVEEARPLEQVVGDHQLVVNNSDNSLKDEIMEDQHCNGEACGSKKLVSDLPVECTLCGVTLRQSRNLRRHMELVHLKQQQVDNGKMQKIQTEVKDESKKPEEETNVQSVQTMTDVDPLDVEQAGPSRLPPPPPPPPHMLSPPMYQCDPYQQFSSDTVFRQHQTELLRGAGLYADTREHCATE